MNATKMLQWTAIVLMAACFAACASKPAGEEIRIGGAFAITGDQGSLDAPASRGALLAVDDVNKRGGVLGRPLKLVVRDSHYKMDHTRMITRELIEKDKVAAIVGFSDSDSALAAGPVAQKAGVPFVVAGATSPRVPSEVGDKIFLACFGDNVQAAAGAEFALAEFGKSACLIHDSSAEYTRLLAGYFKESFTHAGGSVIFEDRFGEKTSDFSAQISKIKALPKQPDFYYISAMPSNIGLIVKQFRAAGLNKPIVGGDGYDTPELVKTAGPASQNVFFTTHALMDADLGAAGVKRFIASYKAKFGYAPEHAFSALGYDSVKLVADAINRAGTTEPAAIQKSLEQTKNFEAVTGAISFARGNHVPLKAVTVIEVKNGRFALKKEVTPHFAPAP